MRASSAKPTELANELRQSLRGFASTVTLLSSEEAGRRFGMVATAVMSVSLEPPAIAVCVNRSASIHDAITHRKAFCVNVLSEQHEPVSRHFASKTGEERFEAGLWTSLGHADPDLQDLPYLVDAQAVVICRLRETIAYGSHSLFLSTVELLIGDRQKDPLLYRDGGYGFFCRRT